MDIARIVERNGYAHELWITVFPLDEKLLQIVDREPTGFSIDELRVKRELLSGLHEEEATHPNVIINYRGCPGCSIPVFPPTSSGSSSLCERRYTIRQQTWRIRAPFRAIGRGIVHNLPGYQRDIVF